MYKRQDQQAVLAVKVVSEPAAGPRLTLRALGRGSGTVEVLAEANITPNQSGQITREIAVAVPTSTRTICLLAAPVPVVGCPPEPAADPPAALMRGCTEARTRNEEELKAEERTPPAELRALCEEEVTKRLSEQTAWLKTRAP